MSSDTDRVPLECCTLPGTIAVTRPALECAKEFQAAIPAGWMVAFMWYESQRMRRSDDAPWIDLGAGIDLGTQMLGDVPEEAIYQEDSFRYAVLIRKEIVDSHPQRVIDLDENGRFILR